VGRLAERELERLLRPRREGDVARPQAATARRASLERAGAEGLLHRPADLVQIDADRAIGPLRAYRIALGRTRPLLGSLGLAVAAWVALTATGVLIPVAIWLAVRWSLFAQVVELEGRSAVDALRRSAELVRHRWLRVASLVAVSAALALAAGPFFGAILILVTDAPLPLLNVVAGVVYAIAMPFVALVTSYVYVDARTRLELEPADESDELPAEIQLSV